MYADDRVLVGVLNRRIDFEIARRQKWYRIPQKQLPRGLNAEYIALFSQRQDLRERSGTIAYFARITGLELARRSDLLPGEEKRAEDIYYKVQFRDLIQKDPPIANYPARSISLHQNDLGSLHFRGNYRRFVQRRRLLCRPHLSCIEKLNAESGVELINANCQRDSHYLGRRRSHFAGYGALPRR